WSQRKILAREERNPDDDKVAVQRTDVPAESRQAAGDARPLSSQQAVGPLSAAATEPALQPETSPDVATRAAPAGHGAPPTLEDVSLLTPDSDFSSFVARGVAPAVKNAAMKKLFADPHFNVMDGLDIYIDDYTQREILPESMMRKMASSKFLKMFAEEDDAAAQTADATLDVATQDARDDTVSQASSEQGDSSEPQSPAEPDADMVSSPDTVRQASPEQDADAAAVQQTQEARAQDTPQLSVSPGLPTAFVQVQNHPDATRTSMI